ncbi:MAG: 50S ribosomal protein L11 methyltransferase [Deltaproteobacteria bacterium]|nr:50S ribosomal protein L11 methyltransferase [Deltaproteobacteria bacterium]
MKIEIAIEGPLYALARLSEQLGASLPLRKHVFPEETEGEPEGRTILLEDERGLDEKLVEVSRALKRAEEDFSLPKPFDLRVRNLAYSEPASGSEGYREPFNPIPGLTVQPWFPLIQETGGEGGNRTIIIDAGNAFGTGKHPTSRLCLEALDRRAGTGGLQGKGVLDFGCGTGLLAIGAVKMGAGHAVGVEIDSRAVAAARRNVAMNGLRERIEIREGSWEAVHETFDFVLANVVPSVLLKTGIHIPQRTAPGGAAIVSGFGAPQMDEMAIFFRRTALVETERLILEGWGALILSKNSSFG